MQLVLNDHGDQLNQIVGFGADVSSQREDDLDRSAIICCRGLMTLSKPPQVLDLACGQGAMATKFAQLGAWVTAVDKHQPERSIDELDNLSFEHSDLFSFFDNTPDDSFHMCLFQRAIHYWSYPQATKLLGQLHRVLKRRSRLYISASGVNSELAQQYPIDQPIEARHARLAPFMANKHGIKHPVTLYDVGELCGLLNQNGFDIESAWVSDFGNVKLCAVRR